MPASIADKAPQLFLGFRAKRRWLAEQCRAFPSSVVEVCSVSDCIAEPPPGWIERWDFNRAACYTSPEAAWATVPEGDRAEYRLYAYWLLQATTDELGNWGCPPLDEWFDDGLPALPTGPGPADVIRMGFDVVSHDRGSIEWGCSPLSCNGMADQVPVNRYCLVESAAEAARLVQRWNRGGVEPGVHFVVAVASAAFSASSKSSVASAQERAADKSLRMLTPRSTSSCSQGSTIWSRPKTVAECRVTGEG